ncbi:MAG TPA: lysylphosphatidylglycerol synthase transmembrane domain-containing protein [Tissierellaceae bacterium]
MNRRKIILDILFLVLVFSITCYQIFHGQDLREVIETIKYTNAKYWLLAILGVIFYIGIECITIYYLMSSIGQKVNIFNCFLYSSIGFFFSCITPSASGGQPAQIYFMRKDKIPVPMSTLVLMIITIAYKMVLVILGTIIFIFRPVNIMNYLEPIRGICYLGLFLNIAFICFVLILMINPKIIQKWLVDLVELMENLHLTKRKEHYLAKIENAMVQYKDAALYFKTHKLIVCNVFVMILIQRVLLFNVTYLVYKSFGLDGVDIVTINVLQGMISVAVDMLPLPGGMGISEKLFLKIFKPIFGTVILPAMVVTRGLSYYTELILSAVFTVLSIFIIGKIKQRDVKA